jgi:hypothetical protein
MAGVGPCERPAPAARDAVMLERAIFLLTKFFVCSILRG